MMFKNSINSLRKMPMKKGTLGNNSYIFKPVLILTTLLRSAVCPPYKCKCLEGSDKASRIYSKYNMSQSLKAYQFSYKIHMKKGTRGNNFYIFKTILILSTLLVSEVCPLVKFKNLEGSNKASRIYSG